MDKHAEGPQETDGAQQLPQSDGDFQNPTITG